jgi:hypothetical protein
LDDLSRGGVPQQAAAVDSNDVREYASLLLSSLATHLGDRSNNGNANSGSRSYDHGLQNLSAATSNDSQRASKRRRIEAVGSSVLDSSELAELPSRESSGLEDLPPQSVLDAVVTKYFASLHHWIPMLHERRFRRRLRESSDLSDVKLLLHAIVASTLKHIDPDQLHLGPRSMSSYVQRSTRIVAIEATNSLSIENCQALTILCFERMGSGNWQQAFPLIGLLVRSVDFLQLTIESGEGRPKPLLPPLQLLSETTSNAETEERKRIFWIAFLLDRLVSVTSGFSTGFTSDCQRRLPCNGGIWRRDEESHTPFFGRLYHAPSLSKEFIRLRRRGSLGVSQARIGNSISLLPTHRMSPNEPPHLARSPNSGNALDISHLGALAYRIEATESLSQVSSWFLQQTVDFEDRNQVSHP